MNPTFKFLVSLVFLISILPSCFGQNFKSELRKLDGIVNIAFKNKKLTANEYGKLRREHDIIRATIEKAEADGNVTPGEKNKIHSKLVRSRKRLAKYKTNREIY